MQKCDEVRGVGRRPGTVSLCLGYFAGKGSYYFHPVLTETPGSRVLTNPSSVLASRLRDGANKEILGIIVSYKVKVKLVVSRGG